MAKGHAGRRSATVYKIALKRIASKTEGVCMKPASTSSKGAALICRSLEDVLQPKGQLYRALLVNRPHSRYCSQHSIDELADSGAFGVDESVGEEIIMFPGRTKEGFTLELSKKAERLATLVVHHGLPEEMGDRIRQDFEQIALTVIELVPSARKVLLGLALVGENSCHRWHRDHDVCRALVTYNSCGTQFVDHDNANSTNLEHRIINNNLIDQNAADKAQAVTAGAGDILVMKGTYFPTAPNGLVHRSPKKIWHADGSVVHRLLLRVGLN